MPLQHQGWSSFLELSSILGQAGVIHAIQYRICQRDKHNLGQKSPSNCQWKFSFIKSNEMKKRKCFMGRKRHGWWSSKKSRDFCWENKKFFNTNTSNWTKWQLCTAFTTNKMPKLSPTPRIPLFVACSVMFFTPNVVIHVMFERTWSQGLNSQFPLKAPWLLVRNGNSHFGL